MTNNTPDYNDNLYFEKKMDCKNCPYTDEYCASGDCERNAGVSKTLTEQWKKGKLINGKKYYITFFDSEPFEATFRTFEAMIPYWKFEANGKQYCNENGYDCVKVLAPVPSYDEWKEYQELDEDYKRNVQLAIRFSLEADILKALLKECRPYIALYTENNKHIGFTPETANLLQQIDEVLK